MDKGPTSLPFTPLACPSCRFSAGSCDRPYLQGVCRSVERSDAGLDWTLETAEGRVRVRAEEGALTEGQRAVLEWAAAAGGDGPTVGLWHLTAEGEAVWRFGSASLLVLEPDWLFSVSDATHFEFCERQRLVALYAGQAPGIPLIRGTLVHGLFARLWGGCEADELDAELLRAVRAQAVRIGLSGLDPDRAAADARPHLTRLREWAAGVTKKSSLISETFRLAPGLGLKGRVDAVWERAGEGPVLLGELKTGRSRGRFAARTRAEGGEVEQGHLFQLVSYAAMLAARGEIRGDGLQACLIYSGNEGAKGRADLLRRVELTADRLREAADIRNRLVLLETGEPPAFRERMSVCNRCRINGDCALVTGLAGHADPRSREGAEWDQDAPAALEEADAACFRHYAAGVQAELAAVREELARLWRTTPVRREAGGAAARLGACLEERSARDGTEGGRTGRLYRVEGGNRSEFRPGDTVLVSDAAGPAVGRTVLAVVTEAGPETLGLAWEGEAGLTPVWVDAYPDESLVKRQLPALYRFLSRPSALKEVLVRGARPPEWADAVGFDPRTEREIRRRLNARQREALAAAVRARDVQVIAGPPGSGKTRLIGALAAALLRRPGGGRILLVAATNRALDQALERAVEWVGGAFPMVRLGGEGAVAERLRGLTPAALAAGAGTAAEAAEAARRSVGEARLCGVTASTLAGGALDPVLGEFEWVIVDEASQMTVPLGLGAASWGRRLVLIGDDRQLPPVARGVHGSANGWPALGVSLFEVVRERLGGAGPILVELDRQYRMNEAVGGAPAAVWYGGRLKPAGPAVARRRLEGLSGWRAHPLAAALDPDRPVLVVDLAGAAGARIHDGEADWVGRFIGALEACGATVTMAGAGEGLEVAVISPYRAQVARIRARLAERFPGREGLWRACVDTVDRFQGGEAEVVLVSLCPPPEPSDHLADPRRLNVALTRARSKVIVLGDVRRLEAYPLFRRLFEEYEKRWPGGAWRI